VHDAIVLILQEPTTGCADSAEPVWSQVLRDLMKNGDPEVAQKAAAVLAE
jgi:hypothetical protein